MRNSHDIFCPTSPFVAGPQGNLLVIKVLLLIEYLTRVCPSGTHGLVYRAWPIKEVDKYKDSKIDLE
jgi:hypothetical protein